MLMGGETQGAAGVVRSRGKGGLFQGVEITCITGGPEALQEYKESSLLRCNYERFEYLID
jgi:hypothetical protein